MTETITVPQLPRRVIITMNDKSCGKTLLQQLIGDVCLRSNQSMEFFHSDTQSYLSVYGTSQTIALADTAELIADSAADVERHEPLLQAFKTLPGRSDHVIGYDTGAGTLKRVAKVLDIVRCNERVRAAGAGILVLVPVTAREDIVEAAGEAISLATRVLPDATIVIAVSQRDGDPGRFEKTHQFWKLVAAADDRLDLPRVSQDMLLLMRESRRPICELADPQGPASTETLAAELGLSEARTELMRSTAAMLINVIDEAAPRLGFTLNV